MATPKTFTLFNKTVAITGATGGIGSAIASRFAREGAKLVLIGRSQFKLQEELTKQRSQARQLLQEQKQQRTKPSSGSAVDDPILQRPEKHQAFLIRSLTDPEAWKDLVSPKNGLEIDILVNCAGLAQGSLLVKTKEPDINQLINTNLTGAIYGARAVSTQIMRRKVRNDSRETGFVGGCIINVASLLGQLGMTGTSVYAATKAGLVGFTKSLAVELAPYIRVNAVLPGFIATNMTRGMESNKDAIPMRRLGTPDEVADAVVFLAKNQYATGCILNLDGGLGSAVSTAPQLSHEPTEENFTLSGGTSGGQAEEVKVPATEASGGEIKGIEFGEKFEREFEREFYGGDEENINSSLPVRILKERSRKAREGRDQRIEDTVKKLRNDLEEGGNK